MEINVNELLQIAIQDEVIIFQTDTVYGIGCLIGSEKGVERIYDIKKRESKKPLAVLCANMHQVISLVEMSPDCSILGEKHWPGALTIVTNKKEIVGDYLTSNLGTVGVRIPNDSIAQKILEHFGPMAVTSLNISSEPDVLLYQDALAFHSYVDYIVKGKDLSGVSSTVYDCNQKRVLRQGIISIK